MCLYLQVQKLLRTLSLACWTLKMEAKRRKKTSVNQTKMHRRLDCSTIHLWESHVPYNLHTADDKVCDQARKFHLLNFVIYDIRLGLFARISKFVVDLSIYHFFCKNFLGFFLFPAIILFTLPQTSSSDSRDNIIGHDFPQWVIFSTLQPIHPSKLSRSSSISYPHCIIMSALLSTFWN